MSSVEDQRRVNQAGETRKIALGDLAQLSSESPGFNQT
jgi:hypothetical protein